LCIFFALQDHASQVVHHLQLFIQGVTVELENTSAQVVSDMPKVVKQVDVVHQEVVSLKDRMATVKR
jgi:hypothetical protein